MAVEEGVWYLSFISSILAINFTKEHKSERKCESRSKDCKYIQFFRHVDHVRCHNLTIKLDLFSSLVPLKVLDLICL